MGNKVFKLGPGKRNSKYYAKLLYLDYIVALVKQVMLTISGEYYTVKWLQNRAGFLAQLQAAMSFN